MSLADQVLTFYKSLSIEIRLPPDVEVLNPYLDSNAFDLCALFYHKYYNDNQQRTFIFGINPGRLGGGITGIPFTDPMKLESFCNIPNSFSKKPELSADFIYKMITAYGSPEKFYHKFLISAVSPLGFTREGNNLNYYDVKELQEKLSYFIIKCMEEQLTFNVNREICYCLGEGANYKFLDKLNSKYNYFNTIVPLPHPRFIMQYKRKRVDEYVDLYLEKFNLSTSIN